MEAAMDEEYAKIIAELKAEFPEFRLLPKSESTLMKVLDIGLKIITFWQMTTFMTNFTTTFGFDAYVPSLWDQMDKVGILKHERRHFRQMDKGGKFWGKLWRIWYGFIYLFAFFPCGLAYYRKKYEQDAYEETLRHKAQTRGINFIERPEYKEIIISHFTSAKYFWTWPFRKSIEEWYDTTVKNLRLEMGLPPKNDA